MGWGGGCARGPQTQRRYGPALSLNGLHHRTRGQGAGAAGCKGCPPTVQRVPAAGAASAARTIVVVAAAVRLLSDGVDHEEVVRVAARPVLPRERARLGARCPPLLVGVLVGVVIAAGSALAIGSTALRAVQAAVSPARGAAAAAAGSIEPTRLLQEIAYVESLAAVVPIVPGIEDGSCVAEEEVF